MVLFFLKLKTQGWIFHIFTEFGGEGLTKLWIWSHLLYHWWTWTTVVSAYAQASFSKFLYSHSESRWWQMHWSIGFSQGHTCHSVIGKTKHQFTRVELGNGRFGIAVTWLSRCIKETVLSHNLFSLSPSDTSAGGVSAWDSLNMLLLGSYF